VKLKIFGTIALVVLVVVGTFCGWALGRWSALHPPRIPDTCAEAEKLRWVASANVQEDFRQHVERDHDMRFLHIFGLSFSSEFPGLQDTSEIQRLLKEHGSRHIEGTTDVISCIEQQQFLEQVFHYAMRYNSMLLGYLECPKQT
jgi:hypothetical protein